MLSASSDPYYVAKEEVAKAMQRLQGQSNSCTAARVLEP